MTTEEFSQTGARRYEWQTSVIIAREIAMELLRQYSIDPETLLPSRIFVRPAAARRTSKTAKRTELQTLVKEKPVRREG